MKHRKETREIVARVGGLAAAGRHAVLATAVRITGSPYRRPGAKFLLEDDGSTLGGVSGGCLEADVRATALDVMRTCSWTPAGCPTVPVRFSVKGAPPAIVNAVVVDALAHLGVRHIDIPITPEKVWKILRDNGVAE